jgi:hypothetical protein
MRTPSIPIEFGGKTRHLIFDFNARAELQDLAQTFESDWPLLKGIRAMIWAGLLAETLKPKGGRLRETSETLSLNEVGEILGAMTEEEVLALREKLTEALEASAPPKADPPKAQAENPA